MKFLIIIFCILLSKQEVDRPPSIGEPIWFSYLRVILFSVTFCLYTMLLVKLIFTSFI